MPAFARSGSDATPDIAARHDKRFVWAIETEGQGRRRLDTARLKEHSGEDPITARGLHQAPFTFQPAYKVFLIANEAPEIAGDQAFWDRLHHIRFNRRIPDGEVVLGFLRERLVPELEGVFARVVRGARAWYQGGLQPPAAVLRATKELRSESDSLMSEWFDARVVADARSNTPLALLKRDLHEWTWRTLHLRNGDAPGQRALASWLRHEKNLPDHRTKEAKVVFSGIKLRPPEKGEY